LDEQLLWVLERGNNNNYKLLSLVKLMRRPLRTCPIPDSMVRLAVMSEPFSEHLFSDDLLSERPTI